jgi:hypothetical protein
MTSLRSSALAIALTFALVGGCGVGENGKEFERQLQVCSAGEENGVLSTAAEACGNALIIARDNNYPPEEISSLSYRLGQIERQRGRFKEAEQLLWPSLRFETHVSDSAGVASRLVELSLSLAGQDRLDEGARLLARAEPYLHSLENDERKVAVNTLRGYAARLGVDETALRFTALALELESVRYTAQR